MRPLIVVYCPQIVGPCKGLPSPTALADYVIDRDDIFGLSFAPNWAHGRANWPESAIRGPEDNHGAVFRDFGRFQQPMLTVEQNLEFHHNSAEDSLRLYLASARPIGHKL